MKIESKTSYRFMSPYKEFKECVDITKVLLEEKLIVILFGCSKKVKCSLYFNEEQFQERYPKIEFNVFNHILFEEIAAIIEQNIVMPDSEDPALSDFLKEQGMEEPEIKKLIQEKADKRDYVQKQLLLENAVLRYQFKNNTMENKLSNIRYEINKYIFPDDNEMRYAVIEFTSTKELGMEGFPFLMNNEHNMEKSKFVCDKHDLDYIIRELQKIKEKL